MAERTLATLITNLRFNIDSRALTGFRRNIDGVQQHLGRLSNRLSNFQTRIQQSRGSLLGLAGGMTSIALAFGKVTSAAITWESAFTGVRKTVKASEGELAALESQLRNLAATQRPLPVEELAKIAELAGQLGVKTGDIAKFTDTIAKLAATTNLTPEMAATSAAQFFNIFSQDTKDINRFGSALAALGNNLATTEAEIVPLAQRLAGAASTLRLTQAETLAFAGAISSVGIQAESGGRAFSTLFSRISEAALKGGNDLKTFASISSLSVEAFVHDVSRGEAAQVILKFVQGLNRLQKSGGNVFDIFEKLQFGSSAR